MLFLFKCFSWCVGQWTSCGSLFGSISPSFSGLKVICQVGLFPQAKIHRQCINTIGPVMVYICKDLPNFFGDWCNFSPPVLQWNDWYQSVNISRSLLPSRGVCRSSRIARAWSIAHLSHPAEKNMIQTGTIRIFIPEQCESPSQTKLPEE